MVPMRPLILLPLFALVACSGTRDVASDEWNTSFSVDSAVVVKDTLKVVVPYGGGFREHGFRLVADGMATKSLPRKQPIRLEHEGYEDTGRALIIEERAFVLTPYRDPTHGRIVLLLDGWEAPLEYVYPQ